MNLSPREIQILKLMACGMSLVSVSKQVGLSYQVTKNYASAIYGKLRISDGNKRVQAVTKAIQLGIVSREYLAGL